MTVRFPSWFHYVLEYIADDLQMSKSDFIRWAVSEHVNHIILSKYIDCLVYGPPETLIAERFFHHYVSGDWKVPYEKPKEV